MKAIYYLTALAFSANITVAFAGETEDSADKSNSSRSIRKVAAKKEALLGTLPVYPGGEIAMHRFLLKKTIKPQEAITSNISGRVYVSFIVNSDGKISTAKVIKGIGYGCDQEALRVINSMSEWKPSNSNSQSIKLTLPIEF